MLALAIQYGTRPDAGSLLGPLLLIVGGVCVGAILLPLTHLGLMRVRSRRSRRRLAFAAAGAERRARALMSELCPHGWHARVHLYSGDAVMENGAPVKAPVALDWFELLEGGDAPAVMRRVWATTVGEALDAMVADRRTDETLEQIELRASAEGVSWPDL